MNFVLDVETLGTTPGCVVAQIGVQRFDNNGLHGQPTNWNLDVGTQLMAGLKIDEGTVNWWRDQNEAARQQVFSQSVRPIAQVLAEFRRFCETELANERFRVWADPDWFDLSVLVSLYEAFGQNYPWPRRQTADVRTLTRVVAPLSDDERIRRDPEKDHVAGDDARVSAQNLLLSGKKVGMDFS